MMEEEELELGKRALQNPVKGIKKTGNGGVP